MCDWTSLPSLLFRLLFAPSFSDWILLFNSDVQCLVLAVLVWYAWETRTISKASQEQAEGIQKPCLTLLTEAREAENAVLEMDGAVGGMVVAARQGNVTLQNMGSGPAINVRYEFRPVNPPPGANVARPRSYLQVIPSGQIFAMPVAREVLRNLEYELTVGYESLSGKHYQTRITLKNLVLTGLFFTRT